MPQQHRSDAVLDACVLQELVVRRLDHPHVLGTKLFALDALVSDAAHVDGLLLQGTARRHTAFAMRTVHPQRQPEGQREAGALDRHGHRATVEQEVEATAALHAIDLEGLLTGGWHGILVPIQVPLLGQLHTFQRHHLIESHQLTLRAVREEGVHCKPRCHSPVLEFCSTGGGLVLRGELAPHADVEPGADVLQLHHIPIAQGHSVRTKAERVHVLLVLLPRAFLEVP
mmetsp:Transcript_100287/g.239102  ORF Transcript_100287/g.239102 Transcript_100287/m.239102 type:complete len:228 (-) Transcript_100287:377-1060(-)